jgi:hypothetical protein
MEGNATFPYYLPTPCRDANECVLRNISSTGPFSRNFRASTTPESVFFWVDRRLANECRRLGESPDHSMNQSVLGDAMNTRIDMLGPISVALLGLLFAPEWSAAEKWPTTADSIAVLDGGPVHEAYAKPSEANPNPT